MQSEKDILGVEHYGGACPEDVWWELIHLIITLLDGWQVKWEIDKNKSSQPKTKVKE